jgi:hypothetical protein
MVWVHDDAGEWPVKQPLSTLPPDSGGIECSAGVADPGICLRATAVSLR